MHGGTERGGVDRALPSMSGATVESLTGSEASAGAGKRKKGKKKVRPVQSVPCLHKQSCPLHGLRRSAPASRPRCRRCRQLPRPKLTCRGASPSRPGSGGTPWPDARCVRASSCCARWGWRASCGQTTSSASATFVSRSSRQARRRGQRCVALLTSAGTPFSACAAPTDPTLCSAHSVRPL
jgi:hypothetical protein